jgi:hypothetical protein
MLKKRMEILKRKIRSFMMPILLLCTMAGSAQNNIDEIISDPSNNYFIIRNKANDYFNRVGTVGTGWKQYKRWEFLVKNNIDNAGNIPDFVTNNQRALNEFKATYPPPPNLTEAGIANWIPLGQQDPTILPGDAQNGVGRTSSVDFAGSDIWVSTPGGGMWFGNFLGGSTYSWIPRTDGIPNLAVQDIEICPSNNNIMYAITGAVGGASGYRSTGVLKSTDAGINWATTGLNFPETGGVKGYKLLSHPSNTNIVWACTDNGLFRTADGGTNWSLVTYYNTVGGTQFNLSSNAYDIVYQPGSTTVMYATSNGPYFYKSTDGGLTFLRVDRTAAGLPTTNGRIQIGVTGANSAYIYLLYGDFATNGYQALYRSTNSGSTFTLRSNSPNILGGQAWRNICIAVSPTNVNDLYVGGLDVYKSTDGGALWIPVSFSGATNAAQFSHADIFELKCDATYLYCASDGGIYRMTRSTDSWISLMDNMQTGQIYRMGIDPTASAAFVTVGLQDNGTYRNSGAQYLNIGGADGMETVVKPSNTSVIYLSTQNGSFYRSDDGGSTNVFIRNGPGNWTTPAVLRPGFDTHIYIGYVNIDFNTTSGSGAWSTITTGFGSAIESLEFAPSNNTVLYATDGSNVSRFNLSGGVWSAGINITSSLVGLSNITEIAVDPNNANHVLFSIGGYNATQKVFETFNANAASPAWTNITRNLPNVPINCIVMDDNVENSIYIGTDIGVFVTNDNRVNWIMYTSGLPTTRVFDIEINTALATNRIYAATFGRGVFYAEVYTGCISSIALSGSVTGLEYNETSTSITSTQFISGGAGTSVAYNSGGIVTLNPGFEAKAGVKLEAYIQGCTTAGQPPRPLLRTATGVKPVEVKPEAKPAEIKQRPEGDGTN